MTPAIDQLNLIKSAFNLHQYQHDTGAAYGLEAAQKLNLDPSRVFKTLMLAMDAGSNALAVAVIPVSATLDLKIAAKFLKQKRVKMADPQIAQRLTGYLLGGISPLGQKRRFPTLVDQSALQYETLFVSAGRRGLEIEIAPAVLEQLVNAKFCTIANVTSKS